MRIDHKWLLNKPRGVGPGRRLSGDLKGHQMNSLNSLAHKNRQRMRIVAFSVRFRLSRLGGMIDGSRRVDRPDDTTYYKWPGCEEVRIQRERHVLANDIGTMAEKGSTATGLVCIYV